ncbi:MAG: alpha/beta fold hydrolase [Nitriliruptorales bacterium]
MTGSRKLKESPKRTSAVPPAASGRSVHESVLRLPERFRPQEAIGLDARWVLDIAGHGLFTVSVRDGRCSVQAGNGIPPDATLRTDPRTWLGLESGLTDGIAAFTRGDLSVAGDLHLALRLETLFLPGPAAQRFLRIARTDVGGFEVESVIAGRGTPVVLLHGLAASKVSFLPTLDGLADRYEVHALDLPGFGKSAKPLPTGKRYSARWMAKVVRDYLRAQRIRHAYLIGNSMGGRIAVEVALRYPRRTLGVVTLGSAVAFDEWQWLGLALRTLRSEWLAVSPVPLRRRWVESAVADLFADPARIPPQNIAAAAEEFLRSVKDARHRLAIAACARHLGAEKANGRNSFWERLEGLRTPSYWVWGSEDRLSSCRYAERVRTHAPTARVEVWDGIGHVPQFEDIDGTNVRVGAFLDDLEASRHL